MTNETDIEKITAIVKEFLEKMTIPVLTVQVNTTTEDAADIEITMDEAHFLIGQNGQTLVDLQRIFRMLANKAFGHTIHLALDINDYSRKKKDYLKNLAKNVANEVFLTRQKKILPPMSAYERRIIHAELAGRQDIISESQGEGLDRRVVVSPVI